VNVPIDGVSGSIWRGLTLPIRLASPVGLLARRVLTRQTWVESEVSSDHPVSEPHLVHDDRGGGGGREGSVVQQPHEGAGPLHHRNYVVEIHRGFTSAPDLLERFRRDPNSFSPTSFAVFVPDPAPAGLSEGETYEIKLPGPWDAPVVVSVVSENRIRLETRQGHLEAGWIEFRTRADGPRLCFEIESFARSGDQAIDLLYRTARIAKLVQTEMWVQVLEAAVEQSGGRQFGKVSIETTVYEATSL